MVDYSKVLVDVVNRGTVLPLKRAAAGGLYGVVNDGRREAQQGLDGLIRQIGDEGRKMFGLPPRGAQSPVFGASGGEVTYGQGGAYIDGIPVRGNGGWARPKPRPGDERIMSGEAQAAYWARQGAQARAGQVQAARVDAAGENFLKDAKEINDLMTSDQRTMLHAAMTNIGVDGKPKSRAQRVSEWEAIERDLNRDTAAHPEKAANNELISRKITALTFKHERFAFKDLGIDDPQGLLNRRAAALFAANAQDTTGMAVLPAGKLPHPAPTIAPLAPSSADAVVVTPVSAPGQVVSRPLGANPDALEEYLDRRGMTTSPPAAIEPSTKSIKEAYNAGADSQSANVPLGKTPIAQAVEAVMSGGHTQGESTYQKAYLQLQKHGLSF